MHAEGSKAQDFLSYTPEEFNQQVEICAYRPDATKETCSKWLKFYFPRTGRTSEKIFYRDIIHWNYSDASLIKRDYDLARRIGIIGLLFKKVEHMHVFTIVYEDNFGDRRVAIMDFDDKQYVQPMKALLSDVTEVN